MSQNHLYRGDQIPDPMRYEEGLGRIEGPAAKALAKLNDISGPQLDEDETAGWTQFLLSLRIRGPDRLAWAKDRVGKHTDDLFSKADAEFNRLNDDPSVSNMAEYLRKHAPGALANEHLSAMMRMATSPEHVEALADMHWFVVRSPKVSMVIGDDPLMLLGSLTGETCVISLPISPTAIFFAVKTEKHMRALTSRPRKVVAEHVNLWQVHHAQREVVGSIAPRFLEKHLRKTPVPFDPPIDLSGIDPREP